MAIGPNGTVYVIDTGGTLYYRPSTATNFTKFISGTYRHVAVTVSNDVWVVDNSFVPYQLVAGKLERRPPTGTISLTDIGGGADGSLWVCIQGDAFSFLHKWNPGNKSFDIVTGRHCDKVDVEPKGRPWIANTSESGNVFFAK